MQQHHHQIEYAGFWRRLFAFILDTLLVSIITTALVAALFGLDYLQQIQQGSLFDSFDWRIMLLEQGFPLLWTLSFWVFWMATPGKLLMDCQIVDAGTVTKASLGQLILRYFAYLLSIIPFGLGFLWIVFDKRNQGWHDKLANTLVIMQDASMQPLESYR